jgi:phospholipase C
VAPLSRTSLVWPLDDGRYDVVITAGTDYVRRYAGTVH